MQLLALTGKAKVKMVESHFHYHRYRISACERASCSAPTRAVLVRSGSGRAAVQTIKMHLILDLMTVCTPTVSPT